MASCIHTAELARDAAPACCPVYQFPIARSPGRLAGGQDQDRLQQTGLTGGIRPYKYADPGRQVQVNLAVAAEVMQGEMGYVQCK